MGFNNKGIKLQIGLSQIIKFIRNHTFAYINICSQIIKIHQQPYICIHQHHVYSLKQVLLPSNANNFNENSLAWQSAAIWKSMRMQEIAGYLSICTRTLQKMLFLLENIKAWSTQHCLYLYLWCAFTYVTKLRCLWKNVIN
jgi:hypothetical protein